MKISDEQLIDELRKRFESNNEAMKEQSRLLDELEEVNNKLIESEKMKSLFLSNIRNEINNPLTSILGLARGIGAKANDKEALERVGGLIFHEAFMLEFQLSNIFMAAELESGELNPEIGNSDVPELMQQIVSEYEHVATRKNIAVEIHNVLENNIFRTDGEKLHVIIVNLLANAIEFSHEGGKVNLIAARENGTLSITVEDFGIGIKLDHQVEIYDRFRQLESGSTKGHGGHGLGLSIVKDLLELLDGKIALESEEGKGSKFTISLPEGSEAEDLNHTLGGNEFLFEEGDELF